MSILDNYYGEGKSIRDKIEELEEENRNLKNELMEDMKTESKLNEEIRNLKSELSKFRDSFKKYRDFEKQELADSLYDMEQGNKKLKEERDFFKEQAILWRKDYKNEYEKNRKLEEEIERLKS